MSKICKTKTDDPLFDGIEDRRIELGLSQLELSRRAGIGNGQYFDYVVGRTAPTLPLLFAVLSAVKLKMLIVPLDEEEEIRVELKPDERRRLWIIDALNSPRSIPEIISELKKKKVHAGWNAVERDLIDLQHKGLAYKTRDGKWLLS